MRLFFGILVFVASNGGAEPTVPPFGPGDRVAFVGDSITHGGMYRPYIETFYATRFPERRVVTFNVGIAGDSAKGGCERSSPTGDAFWESDVRRYKPTAAVIMLGMNDAGGAQFEACKTPEELEQQNLQLVDWYRGNYTRMLDHLEAQGIQPICLVKSSPYDQTMVDPSARKNLVAFGTGKNDLIVRMGKEVLDVEAANRKLPIIDFNTPMLAINAKQQAADPAFSIIGKDRVHPGPDGHMVMAYEFLKAQGFQGPVARMRIDAEKSEVVSVQNCSVGKVQKAAAGVRFEYTAESLPFPCGLYRSVGGLIAFEEEFNQETLVVQGLDAGVYELKIDEMVMGVFSAEELISGINLALLEQAPQVVQAYRVWNLCRERAQLASKSRSVVWSDGRLRKVQGLDRSDIEACKKEIVRIIETDSTLIPYTKGLLEDYLEYAEQYDEMLAELEAIGVMVYEAARPKTRWIQVAPVQASEQKSVLFLGDEVLSACQSELISRLNDEIHCTFIEMPKSGSPDWGSFFKENVSRQHWDVIHFSYGRELMFHENGAPRAAKNEAYGIYTGLMDALRKTDAFLVGSTVTPVRGAMPGYAPAVDWAHGDRFRQLLGQYGIKLNDLADYTRTRLDEMVQMNSNLPTKLGTQLMAEQMVNAVLEALNEGMDLNRPRILMVGDSIVGGYYSATRDLFAGQAYVFTDGTSYNDPVPDWAKIVDRYIEKGGERGWDVIQFNWGLHAIKYVDEQNRNSEPGKSGAHIQFTVEEYARNLKQFVSELKRTKASLIFATTTPIPQGAAGSIQYLDLMPYNDAAKEIMGGNDIPVNDLYSFVLPRQSELQINNNVHFTADGSEALAQQNYKAISSLLK